MLLYRADHKGNKTCPEKFYIEGLLTKRVNSDDDPRPHVRYDWLSTIKSHINPENELECKFYETTEYLSCTTDVEVVDKYLRTERDREFKPTTKNRAEAFVFELRLDPSMIKGVGKGLYTFTYKCNYQRHRTDEKFHVNSEAKLICNVCDGNKDYEHKILVIDARTFLHDLRDELPEEYKKAARDKEWLLLPTDRSVDETFQGRIAIADFWDVRFFEYTETKRNP